MNENTFNPLMNGEQRHKVQMTVRLRRDVFRAAKLAERRTGLPVSVIIADAAAEILLPPPQESAETRMQNLANRVLSRMETLERALGRELFITKELLAQLARAYFNHTPAIPDPERTVASLSGRVRFVRLREQVNMNVQQGHSILNDSETNNGS